MTMRTHIDLIESLAVDHAELTAPEITGVLPFAEIAELFKVDDPLIFTLAMRKILNNHTQNLNDFEILEIAKAFINFVGMTTEEGVRIATRMGLITQAHIDTSDVGSEADDLEGADIEQELADLDAAEEIIEPEIEIDPSENKPSF